MAKQKGTREWREELMAELARQNAIIDSLVVEHAGPMVYGSTSCCEVWFTEDEATPEEEE